MKKEIKLFFALLILGTSSSFATNNEVKKDSISTKEKIEDIIESIKDGQSKDSVIRTTRSETIVDSINGITTTIITKTEKRVKSSKIESEESGSTIVQDGASYSLIFSWNKKKSPHWAGFGMGFLNYDDTGIPNGAAMMSNSLYYSLNIAEVSLPIFCNNFMFVSGIGMDWHRYRYEDSNVALVKEEGFASFEEPQAGINYKKSKLNINYFTIPLLLEYQLPTRNTEIYISAGVVGYLKYASNSKVEYLVDGSKQKRNLGKDLNINPVDLRYRLQVGIENVSIVGTYAPFSLFPEDKGPKLNSYSLGMQLVF